MAFSTDDFGKVWASTSPLTPYEFTESNYKEGWNFIGGTPPARQMWDSIQKSNDEKAGWLYTAHNDLLVLLKTLIPTGCVQAFAGTTTPQGWLLCDGSAISRTDYADLYAVIGDTYGNGDGSTTFNLPNLIDKFVEGSATAGTEKTAGLPNITASVNSFNMVGYAQYGAFQTYSGAFAKDGHVNDRNMASTNSVYNNDGNGLDTGINLDASRSSSIYGNSATVQPPAVTMRYIIKY